MRPTAKGLCNVIVLFCLTRTLSAAVTGDDGRLATVRELSFAKATSAWVAKLGAPSGKERGDFHGCVLRSAWMPLSVSSTQGLAGLLQKLFAAEIAAISKTLPGDSLVVLSPLGFVYGDYAVRIETDRGLREFSICLPKKWDGYIYVYGDKKQMLGVSPRRELMIQLEGFEPKN